MLPTSEKLIKIFGMHICGTLEFNEFLLIKLNFAKIYETLISENLKFYFT